VLITRGREIAASLEPEVFKLLANLVIVVGIGGVASLVLSELNASHERLEAKRKLLRGALSELVSSYNDIKSVRRRLRAEAIRPDSEDANAYVLRDSYGPLLQRLNEAQLRLEAQVRLVEGNEAQYPEAKRLLKLLRDTESYLGELLKNGRIVSVDLRSLQIRRGSLTSLSYLASWQMQNEALNPGLPVQWPKSFPS
jgi:hypothetical protein